MTSSDLRAHFQAGEDSLHWWWELLRLWPQWTPPTEEARWHTQKVYTGKDGRQIQPNTIVTLSHSFKYCYLRSAYSAPVVSKTEKVPILTERRVPWRGPEQIILWTMWPMSNWNVIRLLGSKREYNGERNLGWARVRGGFLRKKHFIWDLRDKRQPSTCRGGESPRQKAPGLDVLKTPQREMGLNIVRLEGDMWARRPRALKVGWRIGSIRRHCKVLARGGTSPSSRSMGITRASGSTNWKEAEEEARKPVGEDRSFAQGSGHEGRSWRQNYRDLRTEWMWGSQEVKGEETARLAARAKAQQSGLQRWGRRQE